jgi:hypothetical protein
MPLKSDKLAHVRVTLAEANAFVERMHRHHKPVVGHFSPSEQ